MNIKVQMATKEDIHLLNEFFKHYQTKKIINNRSNCYTSHNFTVIAKDDNNIVGTLQWYIKENPNAGVVEFEEVFVLEKYRGNGIASQLIKFSIEEVIKFFNEINIKPRKIFLMVSKDNLTARKLYEKFGFINIAELNDLFFDGEIELFYSLNI
ncbi:MAG: GNAT family N-acetyltransferase [Candidatus Pacearchaeota archaeon]|jgi:ribosomal protein S18 acetylase RimI-like enzyme